VSSTVLYTLGANCCGIEWPLSNNAFDRHLYSIHKLPCFFRICPLVKCDYKSSAVAEMGDCGHNTHGPKTGGAVSLSLSGGNPSNTMWPAPRSTSVPSGVFIHPAVWPQ